MSYLQPGADEATRPCSGKVNISLVVNLALAMGLVLFVVLALLRMGRIENQVRDTHDQMAKAVQKVEQAAEESRAASIRASEAEAHAREAAQAKTEAIAEREEAEKVAGDARTELESLREESAQLRAKQEAELDRLQKALSRIAETRRTAIGLVMSLGNESIRFDFDKAALRSENRELLSRIAGILLTSSDYRVDVYGHTDDVGTAEYNQELSERRAKAVRDYLVEAGIDESIISTRGFGKSRPRVEGADPEARAKNRRVEIAIVNTRILQLEAASQR